ncbi:MAG TPA: biotin-dependent carboxyltransferase family protein, partial [Micrococcaceae bacterium]|nr:biotin-dependent carboxyltransferase family protein [Micrococcaceae bacterium]
ALRQANRLAGNPEGSAGLEVLHGGLGLTALTDQVLAASGAPVALSIRVPPGPPGPPNDDGVVRRHAQSREVPMAAPFALLAGETLELGHPTSGLRSYLAVRGGFAAASVMGSRSTDTMSGIGPAPLAAGMQLAVAPAPPGSIVGSPELPPEPLAACIELRFIPGPRDDWFGKEGLARFCAHEWLVTAQSNRIGLRLAGEPLQRVKSGELASEGTVRGAVQIPPEGQPVLFLADHPVTGGYPVIGVVVTADLDLAAQLPPGHHVRFIPYEPDADTSPDSHSSSGCSSASGCSTAPDSNAAPDSGAMPSQQGNHDA